MASLVIASRTSKLALIQAEHIKQKLSALEPSLDISILGLKTQGDRILNVTLSKIGGKGLFIKELETALLEKKADIAVHSVKDIPFEWAHGLDIAAICSREDPRDVLVSPKYTTLQNLPTGAVVGTSSLRRQMQLLKHRSDLICKPLRGNVITRLEKLDRGEFDAIILAGAGLKRLEFEHRITQWLPTDVFLPAVGQGALGIQCRQEDQKVLGYVRKLIEKDVELRVRAERAMNLKLHGSCSVPIAGHATLLDGQLSLIGRVGLPSGDTVLEAKGLGTQEDPEAIGYEVADKLISQGALDIIKACAQEQ